MKHQGKNSPIKGQTEKVLQLPQTNALYSQVAWIGKKIDYTSLSYSQLQSQNQRILNTLKTIQNKLNAELQVKKKQSIKKTTQPTQPQTEAVKILDEKIKNNEKLIAALKRDIELIEQRRNLINDGLQSKTIENKFVIERSITKLKQEIKQLKYQQHEMIKKLQTRDDPSRPQNYDEHQRMEEQLRVLSIKYVRLLDKYNKSTEKLALATQVQLPADIQLPQDLYDKQLEQKEQAQYKEYQGIVKLCTVLSHRNDSEHNKSHREYTLKLKQLEKTIMKLSELDQAITTKQGELIESKKNVELMKVKISNMDESNNGENRVLRLSQGSMSAYNNNKRHSYSSVKLGNMGENVAANEKYKTVSKAGEIKDQQGERVENKLRHRGYSLTKLKAG